MWRNGGVRAYVSQRCAVRKFIIHTACQLLLDWWDGRGMQQSEMRNAYRVLVGKPEWKILNGRRRYGWRLRKWILKINPLTPNDLYMSRTAPLTSKHRILYIYSANIGTEYFKHALYSPFFFSSKCSLFHNANLCGSCIIHILHTECA